MEIIAIDLYLDTLKTMLMIMMMKMIMIMLNAKI